MLFPIFLCIALFALPGMARAADVDRDAEDALRKQEALQSQAEQLLPEAPSRLKDQPALPPVPVDLRHLPTDTPCFAVRKAVFTGPYATRLPWLTAQLAEVEGQCIGTKSLRGIADVLDQALFAHGFVTSRVGFEPQNLASGELRIRLDLGTVSTVRMVRKSDGADDHARGGWRSAFPLRLGDVLDLYAIDQGIEQMERLGSQEVRVRIEPGDEPGTSALVIERDHTGWRDRVHGVVSLGNGGNRAIETGQLAAVVAVDQPGGWNDQLTLSASSNLHPGPRRHSQSVAMSYSVPFGYNLFSASMNWAGVAQPVRLRWNRYTSEAASRALRLQWGRTVWRSGKARLTVYGALNGRRAHSDFGGEELEVHRRRTVGLALGANLLRLQPDGGDFTGAVEFRHGLGALGAQPDLSEAEQGGLTLRARVVDLQAQWRIPLRGAARGWQAAITLQAQGTFDNLVSEDRFSLADRGAVRGYGRARDVLGNNGIVLRTNLLRWFSGTGKRGVLGYAGLDAGRAWGGPDRQRAGVGLAGATVGIHAMHDRLALDLAVSAPLLRAPDMQRRTPILQASMQLGF